LPCYNRRNFYFTVVIPSQICLFRTAIWQFRPENIQPFHPFLLSKVCLQGVSCEPLGWTYAMEEVNTPITENLPVHKRTTSLSADELRLTDDLSVTLQAGRLVRPSVSPGGLQSHLSIKDRDWSRKVQQIWFSRNGWIGCISVKFISALFLILSHDLVRSVKRHFIISTWLFM
jgi:hypothetical protein